MTEVYTELLQENSELEAKILRLEQERNEWKKKYEDVANENLKEIYELIKKNDCWRGVVNVVCSKLEQENKELKAYKDINEDFKKAWGELNEKYKQLRSALEEIREKVKNPITLSCFASAKFVLEQIDNKINEVLDTQIKDVGFWDLEGNYKEDIQEIDKEEL